ncbi:MAG: chlorohydrolase family protein [Candidatus Bathyarchaeota archaeon]|nr:chlorohydrolase family protein [Candidatus Bathyarchaeota archaeon]
MRTKIKASYVVGFDGVGHRMIRDGVVVYEDDRVLYVGKSFRDPVDETIEARGRLVCPGFVNVHALTSLCITHFRTDGLGTKRQTSSRETMLRGLKKPKVYFEGNDLDVSVRFSFAELLKGGATTICEITSFGTSGFQPPRGQAELFVDIAGEMGARAYISHPHTDMQLYTNDDGSTLYYLDEEAGLRALADALSFCDDYEGVHDDRVRTMLFPYKFDACSEGLLRETKRAALKKDIPIHMHTSQYLPEYYESLRRYGRTPIRFLYDIGFLGPKTIITHALYTSMNPVSPAPNTVIGDPRDITMMAESGATLGHTPMIWARIGLMLHTYAKYRNAGINIGIGTDAFPMDMIMEMRCAALLGKIADRHRTAVTATDVFDAATIGGAKALERDDLGRLSPGAKADIVVVDLRGMHTAMNDDPIRTLVYFASQRDIETVIVNGKTLVEDRRISGLDEEKLSAEANKVNQAWKERSSTVYAESYQEWEGY